MADTTAPDSTLPAPPPPTQIIMLDPATALQKAMSDAHAEAERAQKDETVAGGAYLLPSGQWVNALGEPIKSKENNRWIDQPLARI